MIFIWFVTFALSVHSSHIEPPGPWSLFVPPFMTDRMADKQRDRYHVMGRALLTDKTIRAQSVGIIKSYDVSYT